jgi:CheY-like chemotaxis protein
VKRRILVVDDDDAVIEYLRAKLGARYDIATTTSPGQVLELARKHQPALILCDVDMPEMDGGDVSAALFADDQTRDIPLLFLTGLASPDALAQLQGQLGGRPAISKREQMDKLITRIESLMKP